MGPGRPLIQQPPRSDDPAQRHARCDAFGEQDHVGRDAERLRRERPAGAPHPALDLVEDEEYAVVVAPLPQATQPLDRRHDVAAFAQHRLDDHRGHVRTGSLARQDDVELAQRPVSSTRAPGVWRDANAGQQRVVPLSIDRLRRRQRRAADGPPVEAAPEADDARPPGDAAGQLDRAVDCLGPRVAEEHLRLVEERRQPAHAFRQFDRRRMVGHHRCVDQRPGLRLDGVDHPWMAMADVGHRDPARVVEVPAAVGVGEPRAFSAGDHQSRDARQNGGECGFVALQPALRDACNVCFGHAG